MARMIVKAQPLATTPTAGFGVWAVLNKGEVRKSAGVVPEASYLQVALNALGHTDYEGKSLVVDGKPGRRTMSAVAKLQAAAGVTVEPGVVGDWTWLVIDEAMYDGWAPCRPTLTTVTPSKDPQPRGTAIWLGRNRYTGQQVSALSAATPKASTGICREMQYASDVATAHSPDWGRTFVAVDRWASGTSGVPSEHRHSNARDFMADLNRDGNYKDPIEVAKVDVLVGWLVSRAVGWPMQSTSIRTRRDYARGMTEPLGTNGQPCGTYYRTKRHSGPDRLCKIVWRGFIWEWRLVDGTWPAGWWRLKPTSNQHMDHAHVEVAPIVGGVLADVEV
jgi:peptidoglycan hydrolase-like protein with peptidoglycan-binding domain